MKRRLPVSRNGLAPCPSCATHVDVNGGLEHVTCPFCGEQLTSALTDAGPGLARRLAGSIGGALTAALGVSLTVACDLKETAPDPTEVGSSLPSIVDAPELEPMDIYGGPGMLEEAPKEAVATAFLAEPLTVPTDLVLEVGALVNVFRLDAEGKRVGAVRGIPVVAARSGAVDVVYPAELRHRLAVTDGGTLQLTPAGPTDRTELSPPDDPPPAPVYGGPGMDPTIPDPLSEPKRPTRPTRPGE